MYAILYCFLAHLAFARALSVGFPLEDQLPPIARVNSPFSWSFSPDTFVSAAPLAYTASSLPPWLAFDPSSRTLHGTPAAQDEGTPRIKITAQDPDSDTASSWVTLCATPYPPPILSTAVNDQFKPDNPSLSSVFLLAPNSALATDNPSLRVPSNWSFSIGFDYDTFAGPKNVYYDALQADGSPLPPWMYFDTKEITLNGVVPHPNDLVTPHTFALSLRASGQRGYTEAALPFNVIVAAHELSLATGSLPTINITSESDFDVELNSPFDFEGVLVDGKNINASDIVSLSVDTSTYSNWLSYDPTARRLSGKASGSPSNASASLPATLTTNFNQTLHTTLRLAAVPPFFTQPNLDPILQSPGDDVSFSLGRYLSNQTSLADVNLTTTTDPAEAGQYLHFDAGATVLSGTIPKDVVSLASDSSSTRTHATEAVVHRAARATSVKSLSAQSYPHPPTDDAARLVPFTHAARVPVPGLPTAVADDVGPPTRRGGKRIVSQSAAVVPAAPAPDDFSDGMRYVSALGEDKDADRDRKPARLSVSVRSPSGSFSSLESSHRGGPRSRSSVGSAPGGEDVLRVLVRVGERFRFRVHLTPAGVVAQRGGTLVARRMDLGGGKRGVLPAFLYADLDAPKGVAAEKHKHTVKFWGVPRAGDVGVVSVGMFEGESGGVCVGRAVVEVVVRGG
ncbi:hypothetical protein OF83DRAFT_1215465 [Amylostereum chailletii]|nr:hypothetical protein OF83DRAFT_1215465 [Amylostereum chailletii]